MGGEEGGSVIVGPRQNISRSGRQSYGNLSYVAKLLVHSVVNYADAGALPRCDTPSVKINEWNVSSEQPPKILKTTGMN